MKSDYLSSFSRKDLPMTLPVEPATPDAKAVVKAAIADHIRARQAVKRLESELAEAKKLSEETSTQAAEVLKNWSERPAGYLSVTIEGSTYQVALDKDRIECRELTIL